MEQTTPGRPSRDDTYDSGIHPQTYANPGWNDDRAGQRLRTDAEDTDLARGQQCGRPAH
jgi:hypothetical protein